MSQTQRKRQIRTDRLILRRWLPTDRVPFARMNPDSRGMEHFAAMLSTVESDALAAAIGDHFD